MNLNSNTEQPQNQKDENDAESPLYNVEILMGISGQAKILSWVMLAFSIMSFVVAIMIIYSVLKDGYTTGPGNLIYVTLSFLPALFGLSFYIILRYVSESILLFIDLEIDIRDFGKRKE